MTLPAAAVIVSRKWERTDKVPDHIEGPWDSALDGAVNGAGIACGRPATNYRCAQPCPGANGRDDNLPADL